MIDHYASRNSRFNAHYDHPKYSPFPWSPGSDYGVENHLGVSSSSYCPRVENGRPIVGMTQMCATTFKEIMSFRCAADVDTNAGLAIDTTELGGRLFLERNAKAIHHNAHSRFRYLDYGKPTLLTALLHSPALSESSHTQTKDEVTHFSVHDAYSLGL